MLKKVKETIEKYGMLERGGRVCVAVSGGVDSMVLLEALNRLKEEYGITLVVCHLNHGLRGREAQRDEAFVRKAAKGLGLPFEGGKLAPVESGKRKGASIQQWARGRRMEFLSAMAEKHGAQRIATGHTLDDQTETVLMRFLKGSALGGLCGIPPVGGRFIRPLIEIKREEIERYAEGERIKYVVDSTNRSSKYLRNRIRGDLLPFIKSRYNSGIVETVEVTRIALSRDAEYLSREAERAFKKTAEVIKGDEVALSREGLLFLHPAISSRVFMRILRAFGCKESFPAAQGFLRILEGGGPNAAVKLGKDLYLRREYERIIISRKNRIPSGFEKKFKVPGITRIPEAGLWLKASLVGKPRSLRAGKNTAFFDYGELGCPLIVRSFRPGDRIQPLGMKGHRKLKEVFIDEKVPGSKRKAIPLVTAGKEIIWAVGLRQSERFRINKSTKRVLKVELIETVR